MTAVFVKLYDVILTIEQPAGGTIIPEKDRAFFGETIRVNVSTQRPYTLKKLLVNNKETEPGAITVPNAKTVTLSAQLEWNPVLAEQSAAFSGVIINAAQFLQPSAVGFVAAYTETGKQLCMVEQTMTQESDVPFFLNLAGFDETASYCLLFLTEPGALSPLQQPTRIELRQYGIAGTEEQEPPLQ